ncbi:MAG: ATP-binding protein [Smithella sp.]
MDKICTILVGAPGCGKSTWLKAQEWVDDTCVASTDDIIDNIADEYGFTYNQAFKDLIGFAEKVMWEDLRVAAEDGDRIYIDRTNMSRKSRKKFIDFLRPYGYRFDAVVFPNPDPVEWERRLNNRPGKTIPDNIIRNMVASFRMPTPEEGFDNIHIEEPDYMLANN